MATNDPREPNGVVAEIRADVDGKVRRMFFRNGLGGDHPAVAPEVGQRYFWGEWVNGLGTVSRWGTVVARYPYRREVDES